MIVRAFFEAATVEHASTPYNTIHLKVFYPAYLSNSEQEQEFGNVPADATRSPFKVVLFFNGINCGPECYQWLAIRLAEQGIVTVLFSWVAENLPGMIALTPGVDIQMLTPETYGTGPTASALSTLLSTLEKLQADSILAGLLDLDHIILGGHSAGGRIALESASPHFFPQITAAFAYGAHTAAIPQLNYTPGAILALPDALPMLLMGGTCDGVISSSGDRYGVAWGSGATPVIRTFQEGIIGGRNDCYLLMIEGANHFSIAHPFNATTGRSFLDLPATQSDARIRDLIAIAIQSFINTHVGSQDTILDGLGQRLLTPDSLISRFERK